MKSCAVTTTQHYFLLSHHDDDGKLDSCLGRNMASDTFREKL